MTSMRKRNVNNPPIQAQSRQIEPWHDTATALQ